ncbi:G-protein coupled receptor 64-like [Elysia marginata]|uniref:G-protein coupled receptor 64-like n=1 Tax=Elysia marginata TaxID=1093978 RepID=A0AAV4H3N4_9GAST|nr:G-protein coupled receptor 64-like [Elysia marginata]
MHLFLLVFLLLFESFPAYGSLGRDENKDASEYKGIEEVLSALNPSVPPVTVDSSMLAATTLRLFGFRNIKHHVYQGREREVSPSRYSDRSILKKTRYGTANLAHRVPDNQILSNVKLSKRATATAASTKKQKPSVSSGDFTFNLTEAVEIGMRYHDLHCSKSCDANEKVLLKRRCAEITPKCPACRCDSDCVKYGDCCSLFHSRAAILASAPWQERHLNQTNCSDDGLDEENHGCIKTDDSIDTEESCEGRSADWTDNKRAKETRSGIDSFSRIVEDDTQTSFTAIKEITHKDSFFRCFPLKKWQTVYIVATCPQKTPCVDNLENGDHNNSSLDINFTTTGDFSCNGENFNNSDSYLCESCISNKDMFSPVTSNLTGDTYCNQHCLQCHENRLLDSLDQKWNQEKSCRSIPVLIKSVKDGEKSSPCSDRNSYEPQDTPTNVFKNAKPKNTTLKSSIDRGKESFVNESNLIKHEFKAEETKEAVPEQEDRCKSTLRSKKPKFRFDRQCIDSFKPPPNVRLRRCDFRLRDHVIDTCDMKATNRLFQDADNQTLEELEKLCTNHWAPMYDVKYVYKNIFCFICQGQKPTKCDQIRQYDQERRGDNIFEEVSLALLTDLSGRVSSDRRRQSEDVGPRDDDGEDDYGMKYSTSGCKHGFWKDPFKDRCRKIHCSPGRKLSTDQRQCVLADPMTSHSEDAVGAGRTVNTEKPAKTTLYVLNILWKSWSEQKHHTKSRPGINIGVELVDAVGSKNNNTKEDGSKNSMNKNEALMIAIHENKNEDNLKTRKQKSLPQTKTLFKPTIKVGNNGEITFDFSQLLRHNKDIGVAANSHEKKATEVVFFNKRAKVSKCGLLCEKISGGSCRVDAYLDTTCLKTKDDCNGHWLTLLRNTLYSYQSKVCGLQQPYITKERDDTMSNIRPLDDQGSPKQINNGNVQSLTVLQTVQTYTASVMKRLNITKYLLLISDTAAQRKSGSTEKNISKEILHSQVEELNSVLYIQVTSGKNKSFLEQELLINFHGEKLLGENNTSLSAILLSSRIGIKTMNYSFSIDKRHQELLCDDHTFFSRDSYTNALLSFYKLACNLSNLGFSSNDIISFDRTTSCPFVFFNASNFNESNTGDNLLSLVYNYGSSLVFQRSDYTLDGDVVHICVEDLNSLLERPKSQVQQRSLQAQVENVLTLVSLAISLLSLLALFLTYIMFPSLRSLPGKNNMMLVFWLFCAQLQLWLEPLWRPYHTTCVTMGILLHLSWLYAISWTSVCSFHMCRIFAACRGVALKQSTNHRFYISRYLAACSAFSIGLVVAVITGSGACSQWTNLGYGGRGVCYLNSTLLILLSFALPLAFTLVLNCTFFCLTVWSISSVDAIQRQAGRERRNAHVYIRLSSLTGLCWTLSLLAEIPGLSLLRCLSVVVNGSQGFLLFLSYACNRRVARLWSNLLLHKTAKGFHRERGARLRSYKRQVGREGSSSRRTGSTVVAGLL